MIHGKHLRGGAASRAYNGGEARGRDIGKGARLRTVGGYRGEDRSGSGRQARRAKKFGVA